MKKIYATLVLLVVFTGFSFGQDNTGVQGYQPRSFYSLGWDLSIPIGDFNKFISITSPSGGSFSGRYFLFDNLTLGFEVGYNNYYEKHPRETYYFDDGLAVTAAHYRYAYMVPFKANICYFISPEKIVSPYFGLSIGGNYMEQHLIVQNWDFYETQWGFLLSPEVGTIVKFGSYSRWGIDFKASYWFNTNSFTIINTRFDLMQGINFNVGICYLVR